MVEHDQQFTVAQIEVSKSPDKSRNKNSWLKKAPQAITLGIALTLPLAPSPNSLFSDSTKSIDSYREALSQSNLTGYGHNGANEKEILNLFIEKKVANIELDIQSKNGRLYVAHHTRELHSLPWIQPQDIDLEVILADVTLKGLNPHFDLKPSLNDPAASKLFKQLLESEKIPQNLEITISSTTWELLEYLKSSQRIHKTLFTIDQKEDIPKLIAFLQTRKHFENAGVSIKDNLVTEEIVELLRNFDLQTVVWTVNNPKRAVELAKMGVNAISSDRPELLEALKQK